MGVLASTLQVAEQEKEASTSCLGSTLELTLFISHPESVRATELALLHFLHLPCNAMGEEKMPSTSHPLIPVVGKRAGPRIRRVIISALPSTSCNTQENRPCILAGQNSRAGPGSE